ncbi:hypothetical protein B0H65DRAFT_498750 [Neurospora tetraspora]|uniref:Uncharacterized protein n=1 Tax=Neurospora tetraspora TaxID=94610 RepID=A0AAE0JBT1_9PEZI|nr:hypothetical protein B0H65DRAFT_498750 [Neurospora tetraspora]
MEEAEMIFHGDSPYAANTLHPPKPNAKTKGERRTVHDFRPVNANTIKSAYPCHDMEASADDLLVGKMAVMSTTDAKNGYWAVGVREGHQWTTGVRTPCGMRYLEREVCRGLGAETLGLNVVRNSEWKMLIG